MKARIINLVYLNQVAGPSMEEWEIKNAVSLEYKVPFIESRKQPDTWCDEYLSSESALLFQETTLPQSIWCSGCELLPKQNREKMKTKASIGFQRMQHRSKELTDDIFICSPRP